MSTENSEPQQSTADSIADADLAAILSSGRAAKDAAAVLATNATECVKVAGVIAQRNLAERPWVTMGVAAGVGFLVAGGFASPVGRSLMRWGTRFAFGAATRQLTTLVAVALTPLATAAAADAPRVDDVV